jgi:hypothetical protein
MATIVNLRRIERLEEKAGGASWLARLSDAELEARCLTFATGEYPVFKDFPEDKPPVQDSESDNGLLLNELEDKLTKNLHKTALRCSNNPRFLDEVVHELQALGAPKAAALLVEAVKAERLSRSYLWPDWRTGLSEKVLAMAGGFCAKSET